MIQNGRRIGKKVYWSVFVEGGYRKRYVTARRYRKRYVLVSLLF